MKNTVNVIIISDTTNMVVQSLKSFEDNAEGNAEAEKLFTKIILNKDNSTTDDDMDNYLSDGFYQIDLFYVCIVHSTPDTEEETLSF